MCRSMRDILTDSERVNQRERERGREKDSGGRVGRVQQWVNALCICKRFSGLSTKKENENAAEKSLRKLCEKFAAKLGQKQSRKYQKRNQKETARQTQRESERGRAQQSCCLFSLLLFAGAKVLIFIINYETLRQAKET